MKLHIQLQNLLTKIILFLPTRIGKSPHTLHTFANHTSRHSNRNLQKSAIFAKT
jgi:hypothetical protein